jgi:hypothetical protein
MAGWFRKQNQTRIVVSIINGNAVSPVAFLGTVVPISPQLEGLLTGRSLLVKQLELARARQARGTSRPWP